GGGEPLLATDYLAEVSGLLLAEAQKRSRDYAMTVVSNAQAATKGRIAKLMKAGLVSINTTLDPNHDVSRPLKNGAPTFDTIAANLLALPPAVSVIVNINARMGEEKAFEELMGRMAPLRDRLGQVRVTLVFDAIKPGGALLTSTPVGYSRRFGPKEMDYLLWCNGMIDAHGFRRKSTIPHIGCETYMASENFTLNFAGEPSFCGGLDNMPQYRFDPKSEADRARIDFRLANPQWKGFCQKEGTWCPYLLSCWGGCRMTSVTQGLDWSVINCEYEFFDRWTRNELRNWSEEA
ncbi:MAG: hypothetical protein HQK87_07910, partial [Nitrospinae bacterium]|nr:hypothetical protein [Nitrospinota bacterium]